jgi:hypothetical protein
MTFIYHENNRFVTLWGWDHREVEATDEMGRYLPRESCAHPVLVVELALEMGLETELLAVLYDLLRYGPSRIFAGVKRPVGVFEGRGVVVVANRWSNNNFSFVSKISLPNPQKTLFR